VTPDESGGMVVYDSGVARPDAPSPELRIQNAQWSTSPSTIYAVDIDNDLYTYSVNSSGLTLQSTALLYAAEPGFGSIHFDPGTGYLYADGGQVIDPAAGTIIGNFNASGMTVPDSSLNRVFILGQLASQANSANYTIQSFNETTFAPLQTLTLNSLVGVPSAFIRWGSDGLALVTYNSSASTSKGPAGMLYIISDSSFVSANAVKTGSGAERVHSFPGRARQARRTSPQE